MVLYGHRSIVNQVRYNREKCLLASSGVEKIVKVKFRNIVFQSKLIISYALGVYANVIRYPLPWLGL